MNASGFSFVYPMVMSLLIFGGSMEFLAVDMLLSPFAPLQVLLLTLLVQARHLFYGISMLDKFRGMGWKKFFLIFGMCDETFSVNYTAEIPDGVDRGWFMLFRNAAELVSIGFSALQWKAVWSAPCLPLIQHGMASFRDDGHVRGDFYRAMEKRRAACGILNGAAGCGRVSAASRTGFLMVPAMAVMLGLLALSRKKLEERTA